MVRERLPKWVVGGSWRGNVRNRRVCKLTQKHEEIVGFGRTVFFAQGHTEHAKMDGDCSGGNSATSSIIFRHLFFAKTGKGADGGNPAS